MEFHRIFTGVGMGRAGADHTAVVYDASVLIFKCAQQQLPLGRMNQTFLIVQRKYLVCNGNAIVSGEPQDANGADGETCGDCGNGV